MPKWSLSYQPNDKQQILHAVRARQIMYGGAAGGGKSHALRMDGLIACLENPGLQAYLFRRTYPELKDNHLIPIQQMGIPPEVAVWKETDRKLTFYNGAFLQFCFAEDLGDIFKYQGAEMHWLGIDEAALFMPEQIKFLRTRVRLGRFEPTQEKMFPRIVIGSNPGGPSHNFLREVFIEQAPPMHVFHDRTTQSKKAKGWTSVYIPARMDDNPYLDVESYEGSFTALSAERAKALRDGDWDVVAGAALSMLERGRHMVRHFKPPRHWTHIMAMDWGTAKPFSIGWYVVSEGAVLAAKDGFPEVRLPKGAIVRFAEWYGWSGEADTGCRMSSSEVAREVLKLEAEMDLPPIDVRVADPQMWASQDGPSPQQNMRTATNGVFVLRQGRRDRKANYTEVINRLVGEPDEHGVVRPMFYVTANCRHFWRTVPGLVLDTLEPDKGPSTRTQEDHCFAAGTLVGVQGAGLVPIEHVRPGDRVWTPLGWQPVKASGQTGTEWVTRVELADGEFFEATGSHSILTHRGWLTVDELGLSDTILSVAEEGSECHRHSISLARRIGFAASIGSVAARGFIEWCGSIITGLCQRAITFITLMATARTTTFQTLSACHAGGTSRSTCDTHQGLRTKQKPLLPLRTQLRPGTLVQKAEPGTPSKGVGLAALVRGLLANAKNAARRSWQRIASQACVRLSARAEVSGAPILAITPNVGIKPVYNLSVAVVPVFTIGRSGLIVHNCYDEVGFGLATYSRVTTAQDRYRDEMLELASEFSGGGVSRDPYAVRSRRGR